MAEIKEEMKKESKELSKEKNLSSKGSAVSKSDSVSKDQLVGKDKLAFDPYKIIKYPPSTEKSIRQIEFDNKLVFAVHPASTKGDVKRAVEELFKVNVEKINIHNAIQGQKRAFVKLRADSLASDVSADLGLI